MQPKFVWTQYLFGPKIIWTQKNVGPSILSLSNFWDQTLFGPKIVWTKKNVDQQFHLDQILGPNFFQTQVFSDQIFDLTKQISVPRLRYFDLKCCLEN